MAEQKNNSKTMNAPFNKSVPIRYISIDIDDDISYSTVRAVYNHCFGENYQKTYKQAPSFRVMKNGCAVWCPKMATFKKGTYKPPYGKKWVNRLSDDGTIFTVENCNETIEDEHTIPRYVFAGYCEKNTKYKYKFIGVFLMDLTKKKNSMQIFKRIDTKADLSFFNPKYDGVIFPDSKVIKVNNQEDNRLIYNLVQEKLLTDNDSFEYQGIAKQRNPSIFKNGHRIYQRNRQTSINALIHAQFLCEIEQNHPSFIRKNSNKNYTEPHHLVPMSFSDWFDVSLDVEENIVSLCSNCHNAIHYGRDAGSLIQKLYDKRKEALESVGINITMETLFAMYGINE